MCICVGRAQVRASVPAYCRAACTDTLHHTLPACPIKQSPPVLAIDLEPKAEGNTQAFTARGGDKNNGLWC